jgi:hypothetical protein
LQQGLIEKRTRPVQARFEARYLGFQRRDGSLGFTRVLKRSGNGLFQILEGAEISQIGTRFRDSASFEAADGEKA